MKAQKADDEMLRKFAIQTVNDHFIDDPLERQKVVFLPHVRNQDDSVLFELNQREFDSTSFIIKTEDEVKDLIDIEFPVSLHYVKIIGLKNDTILVNIEEYAIEFKDYLVFKRPIRYFVCDGRGQHFTDGTFIYDYESTSWDFLSSRERKAQWRKELLEN